MATTTNDGQHNFIEHNRDHFDKSAEVYDNHPLKTLIANKCAESILEKLGNEFDEEKTELMDFACGTGDIIVVVVIILLLLIYYTHFSIIVLNN